MPHFRCDCCQRTFSVQQVKCYQMRIQFCTKGADEEITAEERDHLLEIHELLSQLKQPHLSQPPEIDETPEMHFQLCPKCYTQYATNPLHPVPARPMGFSNN